MGVYLPTQDISEGKPGTFIDTRLQRVGMVFVQDKT